MTHNTLEGLPSIDSAQLPDLSAVIQWLESGCDPAEAVKELKHYQGRLTQTREALRAQAAGVVPVGWRHKDGHIQWRNPEWEPGIAEKYTVELGWTPLYASAPPAHVPADVEAVPRVWRNALRKLAFMARTSGGTAGPDDGLMQACADAEALLSKPYVYPSPQHPTPSPAQAVDAPDLDAAREMGAKGGPVVEAERLAFEAWMAGHCWKVSPTWNGKEYDDSEGDKKRKLLDPLARTTRMLWAAWRDRAALAARQPQAQQLPATRETLRVAREAIDQECGAAYRRGQGAGMPQAQQGGGDCLTEIRDAISGYYLALDKREHGGIAQDRAFKKIEQALGMNWVQGAALAAKEQRS